MKHIAINMFAVICAISICLTSTSVVYAYDELATNSISSNSIEDDITEDRLVQEDSSLEIDKNVDENYSDESDEEFSVEESEKEQKIQVLQLEETPYQKILAKYYGVDEKYVHCSNVVKTIGNFDGEDYSLTLDVASGDEVFYVIDSSDDNILSYSNVTVDELEYFVSPVAGEILGSVVNINTNKFGIFITGGINENFNSEYEISKYEQVNTFAVSQNTYSYVLNKNKDLIGYLDTDTGVLTVQGTGTDLDNMLVDVLGNDTGLLKELRFETDTVKTIRSQFAQGLSFERIEFPSGLVSIGADAFLNNTSLVEMGDFPDTLTSIGVRAFQGCSSLKGSIKIPSGVTVIEDSVFINCTSLDGTLTFSEGLVEIKEAAFQNCKNLKGDLVFPSTTKVIGTSAFANCSGFDGQLLLPNGLIEIGNNAFLKCSSLSGSLSIPNTVTKIGENAFNSCKSFSGDISLPESITKVPYGIFYGCSGFNGSLILHEGITEIDGSAFQNCSKLSGSFEFPDSLKIISDLAFANCTKITGQLCLNKVESLGSSCFYNCSSITGDLVIPKTITSIPDAVFQKMTGLNGKVVIPDSVTYIGSTAFANQINMKKFYIYGNPTIGSECFYVGWSNRNTTKLYSPGNNVISYAWSADGRTITSMNSFTIAVPQEITMDVRYLDSDKPPVYYTSFDIQINGDFENGSYGVLKKSQAFSISSATGNTREVAVGMNEVVMDSNGSTTINIVLTANNPTLQEQFTGALNLNTVLHEYLPAAE